MNPRVSIIVAAYNGEKYICETLEALLGQSENNIEILVVDDGSTDGTASIVASIKDTRLKYFFQKNSGSQASPRNKGIKEARGDFIGFCDQDDIWYEKKIEKQTKAYEKCEKKARVGIVISSADLVNEKSQKIGKSPISFDGFMDEKESREKLLSVDFITACSALIPKKILDEVGFLDESLVGVDDYDLWLRISEKYGILGLKEPLCAWRQSKSSFSADKARQYIETEKIFKKIEVYDKSKAVISGHGKNIFRIFLALAIDGHYKEAKKYRDKLKKYSISSKMKRIISIFDFSPFFCHVLLLFLKSIGKVSL